MFLILVNRKNFPAPIQSTSDLRSRIQKQKKKHFYMNGTKKDKQLPLQQQKDLKLTQSLKHILQTLDHSTSHTKRKRKHKHQKTKKRTKYSSTDSSETSETENSSESDSDN
ncbi:MAG: protein of unknown function DUF755 [Anelloviridae sp.]|nr:MAG: protein of unknown function DUF755 [Anelloviridae sp.]